MNHKLLLFIGLFFLALFQMNSYAGDNNDIQKMLEEAKLKNKQETQKVVIQSAQDIIQRTEKSLSDAEEGLNNLSTPVQTGDIDTQIKMVTDKRLEFNSFLSLKFAFIKRDWTSNLKFIQDTSKDIESLEEKKQMEKSIQAINEKFQTLQGTITNVGDSLKKDFEKLGKAKELKIQEVLKKQQSIEESQKRENLIKQQGKKLDEAENSIKELKEKIGVLLKGSDTSLSVLRILNQHKAGLQNKIMQSIQNENFDESLSERVKKIKEEVLGLIKEIDEKIILLNPKQVYQPKQREQNKNQTLLEGKKAKQQEQISDNAPKWSIKQMIGVGFVFSAVSFLIYRAYRQYYKK